MNKLSLYLKSLVCQVRFFFHNRISMTAVECNEEVKIYVSLTSYGDRINTVYLAIESILRQSFKPTSITLWLSTSNIKESDLPSSLLRLKKRGLIIKFVDEDIKPFKKLYYQYQESLKSTFDRNVKFVTADDDVFYPKDWLLGLVMKSRQNPNSVISYRAKVISFNNLGFPEKYEDWTLGLNVDIGFTSNLYIGTGVSGMLYPMSSLCGLEKQKSAFLASTPNADDLWFKCLTLKNGFPVTIIGDGSEHFSPVITRYMKGLEQENVGASKNDVQFLKALSYFELDMMDFTK